MASRQLHHLFAVGGAHHQLAPFIGFGPIQKDGGRDIGTEVVGRAHHRVVDMVTVLLAHAIARIERRADLVGECGILEPGMAHQIVQDQIVEPLVDIGLLIHLLVVLDQLGRRAGRQLAIDEFSLIEELIDGFEVSGTEYGRNDDQHEHAPRRLGNGGTTDRASPSA